MGLDMGVMPHTTLLERTLIPLTRDGREQAARPFLLAKYQGVTSMTAFGCLESDLP
jgi:hypothetical protein